MAASSTFNYNIDFPPLSKNPKNIILLPIQPRQSLQQSQEPLETSFLFPEGSLSPLRNQLPNLAPLPSRPSVDNFSRPITQITDEKNNAIAIYILVEINIYLKQRSKNILKI